MKYRLSDLIDVQKIQHLMDILHQVMGPSWAMLDPDGTILARSPWSELCTAFHRANPKTEMRCKDSDAYIKQRTGSGERIISYTCANGLQDIATPIVIRGEFLGAIYVGQFFYEEPNVDFFRKQALEFGFDESAYLKALKAVPVIPRERVEPIVHFFLQFAESIIDMGVKQFHLVEAREALRESETRRRELVEEALRKSEERFRFLVRQVKDYSIIYLDTEGRIVSWNEGAERIFGYREEEVVGKHYAMLHTEEEIGRGDPSRMLEIAAAEGQFKAEGWRVRKDRSRFWTDVVITALRDEFGVLKGFARVGQDITERRNAEEAMNYRLSMEELVVTISKRFINLAPEQMDNEISRTLNAVRDFSGADRCYLSLSSEDGTTIAHVFESCSDGIKPRLKELQRISPESLPWAVGKLRRGETISIFDIDDLPPEAAAEKELWTKSLVGAMAAIPVVSRGTLYGYFALNSQRKGREWMAQDMGLLSLVGEIFANALDRTGAEKERRRLEGEILEGQRREVETRQRENEKWIALGQMASGIAHDIRNPINYVSLALDHISGSEQTTRAKGNKTQKLIENAHSELMRVNEMIKGLLEYGRTQSLNLQAENASAILAESVREVILRHPDEESRIRLEKAEDSLPIFVQRDLLQRALTNLLENALETGGPQVEVRTGVSYDAEKKDKVVLWIQDTGPGIPEENLEKIFIPFFTTKKSGIGIGLTLVEKWVREMGGEIKASNVPEGGARFEILFPPKIQD